MIGLWMGAMALRTFLDSTDLPRLCLAGALGFAGALAAACAPAAANDRAGAGMCAAYGPGFAPLAGTGACVKIGGRVRVDFGAIGGDWRVAPQAGASMGPAFAPAPAPHPLADPSHLRVRPARNF
ncbi:MAG: porin [Rhizobiales bacterium]|nr:porin [Hyphomicrobiales bacterium]